MSISREKSRIDHVIETMESVQNRLESLEQRDQPMIDGMNTIRQNNLDYLNDPDLCITASGIQYQENENLIEKVNTLLDALGTEVSQNVIVTGVTRLRNRFDSRPPLIKISFQNTHEKVVVLRNKMKLKNNEHYKDVYLKSSKSHAERLIELNARTILRHLPQDQRNSLRVDASGRIRARQEHVQTPRH